MDCESLKFWQWAILGGLTGLTLAAGRFSLPPPQVRTMTQSEFDAAINARELSHDLPALTNLVLRPSWNGYVVTGNQVFSFENQIGYEAFVYESPAMLKPVGLENAKTIADAPLPAFMNEAAKRNPSLSYRYLWWAGPRGTLIMYVCGGMLLFPICVRLMLAGGLGRQPKVKLMNLAHYGQKPTHPASMAIVTIAETVLLDNLVENIQDELMMDPGTSTTSRQSASINAQGVKAQSAVTLASHSDSTSQVYINAEPQSYAGVHYPTTIHVKSHHKSF